MTRRERWKDRRAPHSLLLLACLGAMAPGYAAAQDVGLELEGDLGADVGVEVEAEAGAEDTGEGAAADTPAAPADDTTRAREEFAAGIRCVEEHETACAETHFRAALALRDAPAVRYNLASALYDLGRYPEAARLTASVLADETSPEDIRAHAAELDAQLRAEGGTLAITLAGVDDAEVMVDGDAIPEAERGAVLVRAGTHTVTASRDGQTVATEEVDVTRGGTATVELVVAPSPEEAAAQAPAEEPLAPAEPPLYEDWRLWAIVGGAVAVIAIVVIAVVVANENATTEDPIVGNYEPGVLRWD